jgi:hypothetical protein
MATQQFAMVVLVMVRVIRDLIQFVKKMELGVHIADGIVAM